MIFEIYSSVVGSSGVVGSSPPGSGVDDELPELLCELEELGSLLICELETCELLATVLLLLPLLLLLTVLPLSDGLSTDCEREVPDEEAADDTVLDFEEVED